MDVLQWRQRRLVRVGVSAVNGGISLVVLLIAPLGLAAVITLTLLITLSTYGCCAAGDRLLAWLETTQRGPGRSEEPPVIGATSIGRANGQLQAERKRMRGS